MERDDFTPEDESLRRLWEALDRLPEEEPGPALRQRFYRMLDAEVERAEELRSGEEGARRPAGGRLRDLLAALFPRRPARIEWTWIRPALAGLAWALPALILGVALGTRLPAGGRGQGEMADLRSEVRSLSRLVTLSLLEQDSASERLKGVSYGRRTGPSDERVLAAMLEAVAHDPNVNVRLAAIDALTGVAGRPRVQRTLVESFPRQESPLVQIALVDLLVEEPGARPLLRRVAGDETVDPTVRDYLRRRLERRV